MRIDSYPLHPRERPEAAEASSSHTKTDVNADPALNPDGTLILGLAPRSRMR